MAEYIEREELKKVLSNEAVHCLTFQKTGEARGLIKAKEIISKLPTADVVEVKHGKWQEERWCDNFQHTCSLCHKTVRVHPQSVAYRYCPYCGAKMDKRSTDNA